MTELCSFYMCRHFFHDVITACTVFHCRQGAIRNLQKPASPKLRSRHLRATEGSALIQLKAAGRNQEVQVRSICQLKQIYENLRSLCIRDFPLDQVSTTLVS